MNRAERRRAVRDGRTREAAAEAWERLRLELPPGDHDLGMSRAMQRIGRFRRGLIARSRDCEAGPRRRRARP